MDTSPLNFIKMYIYDSLSKEKTYVDITIKSEKMAIVDNLYVVPINDTVESLLAGFPYEKLSETTYKVRLSNL